MNFDSQDPTPFDTHTPPPRQKKLRNLSTIIAHLKDKVYKVLNPT